jgi:filamentous hemagglutinin family protein
MMLLCAIAPIAAALTPPATAAVHLSGVVSGTASVSQNGAITTIRTSNNAILNFSQFDIAPGSTVDFLQPSAASRELDHINSGTPSLVNGSIVSNGTVYLVNPAGVIFGPGAVVDVNGIYVAGSHMADQDFLNKTDHFSGISAVVSNSGQIRANQVYLIGSQVINQGSIVAPRGMVAMLAGSDVLVSQQGSHVTAKVVPAVAAASANVNSSQTDLRTSGLAAGDVYSLAIRHTGSIQAANVLINGGGGQVQVSGSIDASSKTAGTTGGTVAITGGQVNLVSAEINADGPAGGGTVEIGGGPHGGGDLAHADSVWLDSGTIINADAISNGPGGSITLWSDANASSSATLTARGGPLGGDGGYIETSAPSLQINSSPDASSPHGKAGSWVLDPATVEIVLSGGDGTDTVNASSIATSLDGGTSVTLTATGTLSQDSNAPIAVTSTGASTLVLQAGADMTLSGGISTGTGSLTLNVELDQLNNTSNAVIINTNPININGSLKIFGGNVTLASGSGITAASVQINSGTAVTGQTLTTGTINLASPVITTGGAFIAGGTSFTTAATTTTTTGGTIATSNGSVTITSTGAIAIGANVDTHGGGFSATGTSFATAATANISDDDVSTGSNKLSINTTSGSGSLDTIDINGALTWTAGTGRSVVIEGGGNVTLESTASITANTAGALPISLYTTGTVAPNGATSYNNVTVNGTVDTAGAFVSAGGNFTLGPSVALTAASVTLDNASTAVNGDGKSLTNGAVTIGGPVVVTGGGNFVAGGTSFTTTAATTTTTTGGTIATSDGNVTITSTGAIAIGANVDTHGGGFSATGTSYAATANISDDGVSTGSNELSINTTSGSGSLATIDITVPLSWTAGTGRSIVIEGGGDVTLESTASITANGGGALPISLYTTGTVAPNGATSYNSVTVNGTVTTAGAFVSAGGNFTLGPSVALTAASVTLDNASTAVNGDGKPLTNGAVTIGGPVVVTGGGNFVAGGTSFTTTAATTTTTTGGTIATSDGNVTITSTGAIAIGANVDTNGGGFSATGTSYAATANISDDGVSTGSNELSINTTSGSGSLATIDITVPLTWTAGTGRSIVIESGGDVTLETGVSITANGGGALPISLYTTGSNAQTLINNKEVTYNNVTLDGSVSTAGPFVSAGGNFIISAPSGNSTNPMLSASSVTINAATVTPDSKSLNNQSVSIAGPVVTTNGGNFTSTLGTSFTNSGNGTITTGGGNVIITTTNGGSGISIGGTVNTGGGAFTANGPSFTASAAISDGGVNTGSNTLSVNTTSGAGGITISGPISWSGGAGGTGRSVLLESSSNVDIASSGSITATGTLALPVSLYTIGSTATVTVSGIVDTTGDFVSAGGTFMVAQPSSTPAPILLTAASVTINTATITPDGKNVNNASVFIAGPVVTNGGAFTAGGTTDFDAYESGSITTNGGAFTITNTGELAIGQPINTGGGNFSAVDGAGFTNSGSGTITTAGGTGGSMTIVTNSADGIQINANVNTGGGGFSATGEAFTSTGAITDGGVATANGAFLISTTTGNQNDYITIGGAITWAGGTGRSVTIEGPYTINVNGAITSTGTVPLKVVIDSTIASSTVDISAAVNVSGAFVSDGGNFTLESTGSVTALSVALETNSATPDGQSVTAGAVTINGPIVTQGVLHSGFTANGTSFSETASTGTITTNGGAVSLTSSDSSAGSITLEGAVITGGGAFTVNSAFTFANSGSGTVDTGGGPVTIQAADTTNGISIGAMVNTGGGNFSASAPVFGNTAEITDGGVNDSNPAGLTITTTGGAIYVEGPISWAASHSPITFNYATGYGVGLASTITVNPAEPINFTNTYLAIVGPSTIVGGNITLGTVVNGNSSGGESLAIQSAGTVSLQQIGSSSGPIGNFSVAGNNSAAPVTTLNGSIFAAGAVNFAGTVVLAKSVEIAGEAVAAETMEFDGPIEGPGGLVVVENGNVGDVIRFNNNIGDQTPVAFVELYPGVLGLVAFRWGAGSFPPGVLQQQPLTTVNIASGGNFEVNDYTPSPRIASSNYATIDSYGPLTIDIGAGAAANKSNLYAVGLNERLSVYGALTIDANGGAVKTGDISTTGNLTINASTVDFMLRGPTLSDNTEIDTGMDLISGGEMSLPANATYGSEGAGSFDVPGFIATSFNPASNIALIAGQLRTSFSVVPYISPSLLFGANNLLLDLAPSTLSATTPTFVPPIPNVYDYPISGAAPREMLTAGTLPRDFKQAFEPTYPGPVLQQDLKDVGVLTRDPSFDEIFAEVDTGAIYVDLPQGPRPKPADYRPAANRLDPSSVQAFLTKYAQVFGSSPQRRKVQMSADLQAAWDAYVSQNVAGAVSGSGFAQFCATTPSASNAQADLLQLHGLREQLGTLGLSYKEAQVAFQYNILAGMSANGMREGDLAAAVTNAAGSH